jgi:hypothetical protein
VFRGCGDLLTFIWTHTNLGVLKVLNSDHHCILEHGKLIGHELGVDAVESKVVDRINDVVDCLQLLEKNEEYTCQNKRGLLSNLQGNHRENTSVERKVNLGKEMMKVHNAHIRLHVVQMRQNVEHGDVAWK